jgi:hypothetical protein
MSYLVQAEPEKAKFVFSIGESMITTASNGQLSKFKKICLENDKENIFLYFVVKSFEASLFNGHLMISAFMVENGYELNNLYLPLSLHSCLKQLDDLLCVPIIRFFLQHKADINIQAPATYFTPLHIAVQRSLFESTKALVDGGADVNAVADGDLMPLNIAQSKGEGRVAELLVASGAKDTWRRRSASLSAGIEEATANTSISTATTKGKMVKFTGGGGGGFPPSDSNHSIKNATDSNNNPDRADTSDSSSFQVSDDGAMMFSTG